MSFSDLPSELVRIIYDLTENKLSFLRTYNKYIITSVLPLIKELLDTQPPLSVCNSGNGCLSRIALPKFKINHKLESITNPIYGPNFMKTSRCVNCNGIKLSLQVEKEFTYAIDKNFHKSVTKFSTQHERFKKNYNWAKSQLYSPIWTFVYEYNLIYKSYYLSFKKIIN